MYRIRDSARQSAGPPSRAPGPARNGEASVARSNFGYSRRSETRPEGAPISNSDHARQKDRIRAVRVHRFGEDPRIDAIPAAAGPVHGEILIDVSAVGVGAWDLAVAEGRLTRFLPSDGLPFTLGAELCGRVRELGAGVEGFAVGDRVMANPGIVGAWAERVSLRSSACGRAPRTASDAEAAATPVRGLAAWQALDLLDLPLESTLLVVGAGGAVGRAAVEMARGRGLRVIAIAGAGALEPLRQLGAELAVDHRTPWGRLVAPAAPRGVEAALDLVGGASLARALDFVRDGGRVVTTISGAARIGAPRGISIRFLPMRSTPGALDAIADLVERGGLTTPIARTYALEEAAAALDAVRSRDRAPGEFVLLA